MDRFKQGAIAFERLCQVMAKLRSSSGCPWDREQTHESLKPYLVEETYEVLDAIDAAAHSGDHQSHCEELGDLLLQVVFQAEIAAGTGTFDIADVANAIADKLHRRHPHVFGNREHVEGGGSPRLWEALKAKERGKQSGCLDGIPRSLPALLRAYRTGQKAAAVGFDWPDANQTAEKCEEEWRELQIALTNGDDYSRIEEEFGDLLFALVNLSRHIGVNPDTALRRAIDKFHKRFRHIENRLAESGKGPADVSLDELDGLWEENKST